MRTSFLPFGVFSLVFGMGLCWWAYFTQMSFPKRTEPALVAMPLPGLYGLEVTTDTVMFWGVLLAACGVTTLVTHWVRTKTKT